MLKQIRKKQPKSSSAKRYPFFDPRITDEELGMWWEAFLEMTDSLMRDFIGELMRDNIPRNALERLYAKMNK